MLKYINYIHKFVIYKLLLWSSERIVDKSEVQIDRSTSAFDRQCRVETLVKL